MTSTVPTCVSPQNMTRNGGRFSNAQALEFRQLISSLNFVQLAKTLIPNTRTILVIGPLSVGNMAKMCLKTLALRPRVEWEPL